MRAHIRTRTWQKLAFDDHDAASQDTAQSYSKSWGKSVGRGPKPTAAYVREDLQEELDLNILAREKAAQIAQDFAPLVHSLLAAGAEPESTEVSCALKSARRTFDELVRERADEDLVRELGEGMGGKGVSKDVVRWNSVRRSLIITDAIEKFWPSTESALLAMGQMQLAHGNLKGHLLSNERRYSFTTEASLARIIQEEEEKKKQKQEAERKRLKEETRRTDRAKGGLPLWGMSDDEVTHSWMDKLQRQELPSDRRKKGGREVGDEQERGTNGLQMQDAPKTPNVPGAQLPTTAFSTRRSSKTGGGDFDVSALSLASPLKFEDEEDSSLTPLDRAGTLGNSWSGLNTDTPTSSCAYTPSPVVYDSGLLKERLGHEQPPVPRLLLQPAHVQHVKLGGRGVSASMASDTALLRREAEEKRREEQRQEQAQLPPSVPNGSLELTIICARNLPQLGVPGSCDAVWMCQVRWLGHEFSTSVKKNTYSADWNETFSFPLSRLASADKVGGTDGGSNRDLLVHIYELNSMKSDKMVGAVRVPLETMQSFIIHSTVGSSPFAQRARCVCVCMSMCMFLCICVCKCVRACVRARKLAFAN